MVSPSCPTALDVASRRSVAPWLLAFSRSRERMQTTRRCRGAKPQGTQGTTEKPPCVPPCPLWLLALHSTHPRGTGESRILEEGEIGAAGLPVSENGDCRWLRRKRVLIRNLILNRILTRNW